MASNTVFFTPAVDRTAPTAPPALDRRASRTGDEEPTTLADRMPKSASADAGRVVILRTPFQRKQQDALLTALLKAVEHDGHPSPMVPGGNTYFSTTNDALRNPDANPELAAHIHNEMRGVVQGGNEVHVIPTKPNPDRAPDSKTPTDYSEAEHTERCAFTPTTVASTFGACASVGVELPPGTGVVFCSVGTKDTSVIAGRITPDGIVPAGIHSQDSSFGAVRSANPATALDLLAKIEATAQELKQGVNAGNPVVVVLYSSMGYCLSDTVGAAHMVKEGLPQEILYTGGPIAGLRVFEEARRENPCPGVSDFVLVGRNGAGYDPEAEPMYPMDSSIACGIALLWTGLPISEAHPRFIHDCGNGRDQVYDRVVDRIVAKSEKYKITALTDPDLVHV